MRLTKSQKKFIKNNIKSVSVDVIATNIGIPIKILNEYIRENNLKKADEIINNDLKVTDFRSLLILCREYMPFFLILIAVSLVIYFGIFTAGFISGDDYNAYVSNERIRSFYDSAKILQLGTMVYSIFYALFKINPLPLHIYSLFLHIVVSILVFLSTYMLFGRKPSIIATLLFVAHPVNTEAVTWVSGSSYIYQALFFYIILIFYLLYKHSHRINYFYISLLVYILDIVLYQVPWVLTVPMLLVVIDQILIEKKLKIKVLEPLLLFLIPSLLYAYSYIRGLWGIRMNEVSYLGGGGHPTSFIKRLPYTVFMLIKLYIFPLALSIYHESENISISLYKIMVVTTIIFFFLVVFLLKKKREIGGLLVTILVSIAPAFSPITVAWFIADRYLYVGSAFFGVLIAKILMSFEKRFNLKNFSYGFTMVLLIVYGVRTIFRNIDWQTSKSLWLSTSKIAVNSPRVYNNLGDAFEQENDFKSAEAYFGHAIQLDPLYPDATHNLGNLYLRVGQLDAAETLFKRAIELNPQLYQSYLELGVISYQKKNIGEAKSYIAKALEINPNYAEAKQLLLYMEQNK